MNAIRAWREQWTAESKSAIVAMGLVATVVFGLTPPAVAAGPVIRAVPASIGLGQEWTVAGSGFCARPGCSAVSITADGRPLAPPVTVRSDGSFEVTAVAGPAVGFVRVVASQRTDNGSTVQAATSLTINPAPPVAPGTTRPSTSTTKQPPQSTTTPTSATEQPPPSTTTPTSTAVDEPSRTTPNGQPARDDGRGTGRLWVVLAVGALVLGAAGWLARRRFRHKR